MKYESISLDTMIGGGQVIGTLMNGKKALVWGGLPGEVVDIEVTKKRSKHVEGYVTQVHSPSADRSSAREPESFLSTSPWQIMTMEAESRFKQQLVSEAFKLHDVELPSRSEIYSDNRQYGYRNKVEFSFWWDDQSEQIELSFFRRGTHGKIVVDGTALASDQINDAARRLRSILREHGIRASSLKTAIIRSTSLRDVVVQLYVKDSDFPLFSETELQSLAVQGFELIYSSPKSPASVITKRLQQTGDIVLRDDILGVSFQYATEGFFQINLPVYEEALRDMRAWILPEVPVLDLYSGVGSIGLTIAHTNPVTLVELNEHAVREMKRNIAQLGKTNARAVQASSESIIEMIDGSQTIIVDPPRAGLHSDVRRQLLQTTPPRIIYLSCNPVTQARDAAELLGAYDIAFRRGYNFFPRTPHIEHLVVLERKS